MTDTNEADPRESSALQRMLTVTVSGLVVVFTLGATAGLLRAAFKHGELSAKGVVALLVLLTILVLAVRVFRKGLDGQWLARSPRRRDSQLMLYLSAGIGLIIGMALNLGDPGSASGLRALFTDAPMSPLPAGLVIACLPVIGVLCWRWHRAVDEHELAVYNMSGVIALYVYLFVSTGWWFAAKAGWLPSVDGLAVFWLVMAIWGLGWLWGRYR